MGLQGEPLDSLPTSSVKWFLKRNAGCSFSLFSFVLPGVGLLSESSLSRPMDSSLQLSPRLPTAQLHRPPPTSNSGQGAEGQGAAVTLAKE